MGWHKQAQSKALLAATAFYLVNQRAGTETKSDHFYKVKTANYNEDNNNIKYLRQGTIISLVGYNQQWHYTPIRQSLQSTIMQLLLLRAE